MLWRPLMRHDICSFSAKTITTNWKWLNSSNICISIMNLHHLSRICFIIRVQQFAVVFVILWPKSQSKSEWREAQIVSSCGVNWRQSNDVGHDFWLKTFHSYTYMMDHCFDWVYKFNFVLGLRLTSLFFFFCRFLSYWEKIRVLLGFLGNTWLREIVRVEL